MRPVYIHRFFQDLNDDADGEGSGRSSGIHWRGAWWFREHPEAHESWSIHWELKAPCRSVGIEFRADDNDQPLHWHVGLGALSAWLSIDASWARRFRDWVRPRKPDGTPAWAEDREISVRFHDTGIWWVLWTSEDTWGRRPPRWRRGGWYPLDTVLGKLRYSSRDLSTTAVEIPMPEGTYPATVRVFESTWKRPRWPVAKRLVRAEVTVDNPPRFAGKGENSWDLDDDAIYGLTTPAHTVEDAIGAYVAAVLRNRRRYGAPSERPS